MKRIAIFASGNGTNAENIIRYFQASDLDGEVALVISNNPEAKVIQRGRNLGVDTKVMTRQEINTPTLMLGLRIFNRHNSACRIHAHNSAIPDRTLP